MVAGTLPAEQLLARGCVPDRQNHMLRTAAVAPLGVIVIPQNQSLAIIGERNGITRLLEVRPVTVFEADGIRSLPGGGITDPQVLVTPHDEQRLAISGEGDVAQHFAEPTYGKQ